MHGDLAAQLAKRRLVARAFQRDQHADAADARRHGVVDIGGDDAFFDRQAGGATQLHVLANGGDHVGHFVLDGLARLQLGAVERFDRVMLQAQFGETLGGVLEQVVARDKVRLGVELDGGPDFALAVFTRGDGHQALGGDAVGLLGGLGQALGAQPVDGGFDVAVVFLQGLLAVHHAHARTLAKLLHEGGGDLGHVLLLWDSYAGTAGLT